MSELQSSSRIMRPGLSIRKIFRFVYLFLFLCILAMSLMVILIYTNQRQIDENPLISIVHDEDLRQATGYILVIAALLVVLATLLVLLYRFMTRHIERPMKELIEQTKKIRDDQNRLTERMIEILTGEESEPFAVKAQPLSQGRSNEFNELAEAHNRLISNLNDTGDIISMITGALKTARDKLRDVNEWLEKTVEERTLDLTKANAELEKAHRELSTLDKAKSDFLRLVSHEIRTPLNGIQGFTWLMKDMPQAPEVAEIFSLLDTSVKRLERFSTVALLITRLQTRSQAMRWEWISPADITGPPLASLQEKIGEKQLKVRYEGDLERHAIRGDKELMRICAENILDNSIRYSFPGGIILIRVTEREKKVCLEFIDQGKGFSENALRNLFRTFSPGEEHIDENVGLDLVLVKMIMDAHSGQTEVGNNPEGGALVRLTFSSTEESGSAV